MLEIVPVTRWVEPSREAREDDFLGLKRTLTALDIPWRETARLRRYGEKPGDAAKLVSAPEKTAFILSSCFNWEGAPDLLVPWVKDGGVLFIADDDQDWELQEMLGGLGVEFYNTWDPGAQPDENEDHSPEASIEFESWQALRVTGKKADRISAVWDGGFIKLLTLHMGKGSITITGRPAFLYARNLRNEENAALVSDLLITPARSSGLLFFLVPEEEHHLFGALAERGDIRPAAVSLLLLLAAGFAAVIPRFGRNKPEPRLPGRPLAERFSAEGRFFEKYRALENYALLYRDEYEQYCKRKGIIPDEIKEIPLAGKMDRKTFAQYQKIILSKIKEGT
jgi:hypothetical protein